MTAPDALLQRHFGHDRFLPGQREVIGSLLAGHSAAAVFPTGGGKSLCYQLPGLALDGTTLVVSPLIALMKDQIDQLSARGHRAVRLDSSLDADSYREAMDAIRAGDAKLVYVAPERFNNERFRQSLRALDVALFAVDEAHCISEWGHNFRPDYLKLPRYAGDCGARRILALTATATEQVLADVCESFGIDPARAVRTTFYRPNLTLLMTAVEGQGADEDDPVGGLGDAGGDRSAHRAELLQRRLEERPRGATVVYVTRQRAAEEVAARLADSGLPARAYHAGMKAEERSAIQEWFFTAEHPIVVATIAFGMGIDKADIRFVYHYNLPKSLESYSQEIGRAGRDGEPSTCELFASTADLTTLENFAYGDTPSGEAIRIVVERVLGGAESVDVSLYELAQASDARQIVVQTLLTYLELEGFLEAGTPYYSRYELHPLASSREILDRFEGKRRAFLETLFRHAEKRKKWIALDLEGACREAGAPRSRAVRALDHLSERGFVELRALGVRHRYRVLRRPESSEALCRRLAERFARRERAEIGRLQQVIGLVEADACQVSRLGAHFGEPLPEPCGHCSFCFGDGEAVALASRAAPEIEDSLWENAQALRREHPEALGEPRAFARFLCGLSSPRQARARLGSHELAGSLRAVPFDRVLARAAGAA